MATKVPKGRIVLLPGLLVDLLVLLMLRQLMWHQLLTGWGPSIVPERYRLLQFTVLRGFGL